MEQYFDVYILILENTFYFSFTKLCICIYIYIYINQRTQIYKSKYIYIYSRHVYIDTQFKYVYVHIYVRQQIEYTHITIFRITEIENKTKKEGLPFVPVGNTNRDYYQPGLKGLRSRAGVPPLQSRLVIPTGTKGTLQSRLVYPGLKRAFCLSFLVPVEMERPKVSPNRD